jgi:hypothetical protein
MPLSDPSALRPDYTAERCFVKVETLEGLVKHGKHPISSYYKHPTRLRPSKAEVALDTGGMAAIMRCTGKSSPGKGDMETTEKIVGRELQFFTPHAYCLLQYLDQAPPKGR